jgi:cell division protein FtsZ
VPVRVDPPEINPSKYPIKIVGVGGFGCNTVNRMFMRGIIGAELLSVHTDAEHMLMSCSTRKLLIGREVCCGLGSRGDRSVGERAALESEWSIREFLKGPDVVFVISSLGGGTGSGAAPVVARVASEAGAMTFALCVAPFAAEKPKMNANVEEGLKKLIEVADSVLVFPNERLMEAMPKMSMNEGLMVSDELFLRVIRGVTQGYVVTDDDTRSVPEEWVA